MERFAYRAASMVLLLLGLWTLGVHVGALRLIAGLGTICLSHWIWDRAGGEAGAVTARRPVTPMIKQPNFADHSRCDPVYVAYLSGRCCILAFTPTCRCGL